MEGVRGSLVWWWLQNGHFYQIWASSRPLSFRWGESKENPFCPTSKSPYLRVYLELLNVEDGADYRLHARQPKGETRWGCCSARKFPEEEETPNAIAVPNYQYTKSRATGFLNLFPYLVPSIPMPWYILCGSSSESGPPSELCEYCTRTSIHTWESCTGEAVVSSRRIVTTVPKTVRQIAGQMSFLFAKRWMWVMR